jgi:hypothetical protein
MAITLTVEDGSRPTGANTYASVLTADAYHADRAFAAWDDATDDEKATALIKATDYLNGLPWNGRKVALRVMAWPRVDMWLDGYAIATDDVPDEVVNACCYMAGEFIGGADPLAPQDRALSSMKVGSVEMAWEQGASQAPQYPALRSILRGLIGAQNVVRLVAG